MKDLSFNVVDGQPALLIQEKTQVFNKMAAYKSTLDFDSLINYCLFDYVFLT